MSILIKLIKILEKDVTGTQRRGRDDGFTLEIEVSVGLRPV